MTTEASVFVRIPGSADRHVVELASRADAALARSSKLPPGDRTEAVRFESLHAAIDQLAIAAMANGEPHVSVPDNGDKEPEGTSVLHLGAVAHRSLPDQVSQWLSEGAVVVELRFPHFRGETKLGGDFSRGPPRPATRWKSTTDKPKEAVRERFEYLIAKAVAGENDGEAAIFPSGVANSVLTEGLRQNVQRKAGEQRINAPVRYRDGSQGPPFPLRALDMTDRLPGRMAPSSLHSHVYSPR